MMQFATALACMHGTMVAWMHASMPHACAMDYGMIRDKILIETKLCYISGTIVLAHTFYTANQPMWQTNYTVWSARHFFNPISKRYGV